MNKAASQRRGKLKASKMRNKCVTGKTRFRDHKECVALLHNSANRRVTDIREHGFTKRNEIRSYPCNLCSGYHVSSKESWGNMKKAA